MKKQITSGYINGKFEKSLPLFIFAQTEQSVYWSNKKRVIQNKGVFNIVVAPKGERYAAFRGLVFPVNLFQDESKKDFFLKLQRFLRKNRKNPHFISAVNKYLEENGYGYLQLNPNKTSRFSYLVFEINEKVYLEFLQDCFYMTKVLDGAREVIEVVETKEFHCKSYTQFLENLYTKEKLLKYDIFPFELVYIYESVIGKLETDTECEDDVKLYRTSRYNLEEYFTLKKDVVPTELVNVKFEFTEYSFINMILDFDSQHVKVQCSPCFDPFLNIYRWLELIKKDANNHVLEIDEEGTIAVFKAFYFGKYSYLVIYYKWEDKLMFEGVVKRESFVDSMYRALEDFIFNDFSIHENNQYWQDSIQNVKSILLTNNFK